MYSIKSHITQHIYFDFVRFLNFLAKHFRTQINTQFCMYTDAMQCCKTKELLNRNNNNISTCVIENNCHLINWKKKKRKNKQTNTNRNCCKLHAAKMGCRLLLNTRSLDQIWFIGVIRYFCCCYYYYHYYFNIYESQNIYIT